MIEPDLVDFAVDAARRAGGLTLEWYQRRGLSVTAKSDGSPVTEADLAAERLLRSEIAAAYPDDMIRGEEEGDDAGLTGRIWVIDPIDGTRAFTQGVPLFATLLALVDDQGPAVGVICLPALDECVWAGRGRGALWDGEPCRVSTRASVEAPTSAPAASHTGPTPPWAGSGRPGPGSGPGATPTATPSSPPDGPRPWSTLSASTGTSPRCR